MNFTFVFITKIDLLRNINISFLILLTFKILCLCILKCLYLLCSVNIIPKYILLINNKYKFIVYIFVD